MTDIALQWLDGVADVSVSGADLAQDAGLETGILISLFCDARADATDELPPGETNRRGWWGDQFGEPGDRTGSKLWLLKRAKRVPETLRRAQHYSEQALRWLINDGIAASVRVVTSFERVSDITQASKASPDYALVIEINLIKPNGSNQRFRFAGQWQAQVDKDRTPIIIKQAEGEFATDYLATDGGDFIDAGGDYLEV